MSDENETIDTGRRQLLQGATVAAATVALGGLGTRQARAQSGNAALADGRRMLGNLEVSELGLGLILAVVNLALAFLLLVNAVGDIPLELEEAGRMDGARLWRLLWYIVLPLCRPALITTFIFGFITAWNEFLFGLMLTTQAAVPVTVGASFFFATSGGGVQWGVAAAVMIIAALPPLLLGLVMYRRISGSMVTGAVKG